MNAVPPQLLWVTNHQAPYRERIWSELSRSVGLHVAFLFGEEPERRWSYSPSTDYASTLVPTRRLPIPAPVRRMLTDPPVLSNRAATQRLTAQVSIGLLGGWEQPAYFQFLFSLKRQRKPVLMFYESTGDSHHFDSGPVDAVRSWYFRQADRVFAPSAGAAMALGALGVDEGRIVRTANGVDLDTIAARANATRKTSAQGPVRRFIYVGQLIERKNLFALLEGFAQLSMPAELRIVGGGPLRDTLGRRARELGIAGSVEFVDHVAPDEVPAYLGRSEILVLPSTEEVFGFTVVEAMAAGLSVVVSNRAGVAAEIAGERGVYVTEPTVAHIAHALEEAAGGWGGVHSRDLTAIAGVGRLVADVSETISELGAERHRTSGGICAE